MITPPGLTSTPASIASRARVMPVPQVSRWFYVVMAGSALLIELTGFWHARQQRIDAHIVLSRTTVLHATLFSSWVVLFSMQTLLAATHRVRLHRRLGLATAAIAAIMVALALPLAIDFTRRAVAPDPIVFLLIILVDAGAFAVFVAAGIWFRRRREAHKRFMLLGMASLLPPGISRWPIAVTNPAPAIMGTMLLFLAAMAAHDLLNSRRVHPVSGWGGLALLTSIPVRFAVAQTAAWHTAAHWMLQLGR